MKSKNMEWKPDLVEEAVFVTVACHEDMGDEALVERFHNEKNALYEAKHRGSEKDAAFQAFHERTFSVLNLDSFYYGIVEEFPYLNRPSIKIVFRRAWSRKEEGAELYVYEGMNTVIVKMQVIRMQDLGSLATYLRHELAHVSDMLDPQFDYMHDLDLGGTNEVEDNLIRDRFRVLWDLAITSRLQEKGHEVLVTLEKQRGYLEKAFSAWEKEDRNKIFEAMTNKKSWNQTEILNVARGLWLTRQADKESEKCFLCDFPSHERVTSWDTEEARIVAERIRHDRGQWNPKLKTCPQCYELYRAQSSVEVQP